MEKLQSFLGFVVFMIIAWSLARGGRRVDWRIVAGGVGLQFLFGLLLLKAPGVEQGFMFLNKAVLAIEKATTAGTSFVFGYLGGGKAPFEQQWPQAGYILAFRALPIILVMSALSAVLFHLRILPLIVRGFSFVLRRSMGIGGALGVGASVNIFVGMVEAPVFVRPYLSQMSRSELFALMTTGMATVAGTMLVLYAGILDPVIPNALGNILTASIISAPAAILISRLMEPETREATAGEVTPPHKAQGLMDAVTRGALQGVELYIPIIALLVVLVALVSLVNQGLGFVPEILGEPLTLQRMLGWVMAPVVWLMGVPWEQAQPAGMLMGVKVVLNEFIAYLNMAHLPPDTLDPRTRLIMTYAMCGFANFGSLGIIIGGMGAMAPDRRDEIVALGLRSIVGGVLATCMTGCVVGMLT